MFVCWRKSALVFSYNTLCNSELAWYWLVEARGKGAGKYVLIVVKYLFMLLSGGTMGRVAVWVDEPTHNDDIAVMR